MSMRNLGHSHNLVTGTYWRSGNRIGQLKVDENDVVHFVADYVDRNLDPLPTSAESVAVESSTSLERHADENAAGNDAVERAVEEVLTRAITTARATEREGASSDRDRLVAFGALDHIEPCILAGQVRAALTAARADAPTVTAARVRATARHSHALRGYAEPEQVIRQVLAGLGIAIEGGAER